ncbi:MAG TPA: STAS domain-containing protein [Acidiferrobacterales bacterium]|nr:STAS domain-containing protein [Acidiferrobacterales bacterium]
MGPVQIRRRNNRVRLVLSENLTISQAALLHKKLSKGLAAKLPLILNGEQVRQVDTAALQVLVAFCQAAQEQGLPLHYQTPDDYLHLSVRLLGLTAALEPNQEMAA